MITWRDHFRALMRNCRRDPMAAWVNLGMILLIAVLIALMCGCMGSGGVAAGTAGAEALASQLQDTKHKLAVAESDKDTLTGEVKSAHERSVDADHALAAARGLYEQTKADDAQAHADEASAKLEAYLAPLRTILLVVSILGVLLAIGGIVVVVLVAVSSVPFGKRIGWVMAAVGAVCFVAAQVIAVSLSHVALLGAVAGLALVSFVAWLIWDRHHTQVAHGETARLGDEATALAKSLGGEAQVDALKAAAMARQRAKGVQARIATSLSHLRPRWSKAA